MSNDRQAPEGQGDTTGRPRPERRYDPAIFIGQPYQSCPQCGQESFGRVWVGGTRYMRRCARCGYRGVFELPQIRKKLIYLDQSALSEMMKSLNPRTKAHAAGRVDPMWRETFERLDRLSKLQLIVCPESAAHEEESSVSPFFEPLRRLYGLLSHGVRFLDHATITRFQLAWHARDWIAGRGSQPLVLDRDRVLEGNPNAWTDTLQISVQFPMKPEEIEEGRRGRDEGGDLLAEIFRRWQAERGRRFDDWFQEEGDGLGPSLWSAYAEYLGRWHGIITGARSPTIEDVLPNSATQTVQDILRVIEKAGFDGQEALTKAAEFLSSPTLREVPVVRIQALLFAALAHQAASGRTRLPSRGTFTDIRVVATLLPYCDAMLLDNEVRSLLSTGPVNERLSFATRVFSKSNLREFHALLDEVADEASPEHLALIQGLYGEVEPFTTVFELEDRE